LARGKDSSPFSLGWFSTG